MCGTEVRGFMHTRNTPGQKAVRHRMRGMRLTAEIPHKHYGSVLFVCNYYVCDSTSTTNNIQSQLNNLWKRVSTNHLMDDSATGATSDPHR